MIISGELEDSSTVTVGCSVGQLTYSVERKPLPAGANGQKRPINLDPMGYMVEEASDDDDSEMRE